MTAASDPTRPIVLVGCGKMGGALLAGWRERRIAPHFHIVEPAIGPTFPDTTRHAGPESLPADLTPAAIVLAVKPQSLDAVLPPYRSFAARGVPFVYSTGNGGPNMRDGYRDRPVLKKPFKYEELVEMLTRLLSR